MSIESRRLGLALVRAINSDARASLYRDDLDELEHALDAYADRIALGIVIAVTEVFREGESPEKS